jgi:uncharacterized protein Veg
MGKLDVQQVRKIVNAHIGSKVRIRLNRGRHRIDIIEGVITETYSSIFLVEVANKEEESRQRVSFGYTDVLTKDVRLSLV